MLVYEGSESTGYEQDRGWGVALEEMKKPRDGADCREIKGESRGPG